MVVPPGRLLGGVRPATGIGEAPAAQAMEWHFGSWNRIAVMVRSSLFPVLTGRRPRACVEPLAMFGSGGTDSGRRESWRRNRLPR